MANLDRFKEAQDQRRGGFDAALAEMRAGRKRSHWIWYIFPQLAGMGSSGMAQQYAISDLNDAIEYLDDPVLRDRLVTITEAVAEQVRAGVPLDRLMASHIDVLKLVSSLTLFSAAARARHASGGEHALRTFAAVADEVLDAAAAQGYPRCRFTLARLEH